MDDKNKEYKPQKIEKIMEKRTYDTPKVKVVAFQVEQGFQGTNPRKIGNLEATGGPQPGTEHMNYPRDWWENAI